MREKYKYNFKNAHEDLEYVRGYLDENKNKNYIKPSKYKIELYNTLKHYFPQLDETEEFRKKNEIA